MVFKIVTMSGAVLVGVALGLALALELYRSTPARSFAYGLSEQYCWNGAALDWHDGRFCSAVYMIVGDY